MIEAKRNDDDDRHSCYNCTTPTTTSCYQITIHEVPEINRLILFVCEDCADVLIKELRQQ